MNDTPEARAWIERCRRRVEEWVSNPAGLPPTQAEILVALRAQEQEDHNREWRRIRSPEYQAQEAERTAREQERLEQEYKKWAEWQERQREQWAARQVELKRQEQLKAKAEAERRAAAEAEHRAAAERDKADYEQWLRAQRDQQDAEEKRHKQQIKAAATHRRRQEERAAAMAKAQAERDALATDSLDNYPDENGKKYLQIELKDLDGVTERWEEHHTLDEEEAGAWESAWWQHTENQREHGIIRMAQYHLERLAGKPLYQCPWSKMPLIGGGNDMPHRGRRNLPKL